MWFTPKPQSNTSDAFVEVLRELNKPMQWSSRPGWVCPKCGRVWGPTAHQCDPCNRKVATREPAPPPSIPPAPKDTP